MRLIADRSERLDLFLARCLPQHSRTKLARAIAGSQVVVNGKAAKPSFLLKPGAIVEIEEPGESMPHDLVPASVPLDVRYEDEYLLVINKARRLAVHPAPSLKEPSLVNALLGRSHPLSVVAGAFRPGIVRRLDKETTGLLLVAKLDAVHIKLARQIESKRATRRYVAAVEGLVPHDRFDVAAPIARNKANRMRMAVDPAGKPSLTHFKKLGFASRPDRTLLAASLETGRTHQIRVHLKSVGFPILGDPLYAPLELRGLPLQLHAAFLSFQHPISGEKVAIYAEPPDDFLFKSLVDRGSLEDF